MQPTNNNGSIIIRFSKFGYKYSLTNLGKFDDTDNHYEATRICRAIELDISMGRFIAVNNDELFKAYHPLAKLSSHHESNSFTTDAISMIEAYLDKKEFRDRVLIPCLTLLRAYGKQVKTKDEAFKFWQWFSNDGKRSNNSNNLYLATLKPVCPMFTGIKPLKASKVQKDEKPFSKDEIRSILEVFDKHFAHYRVFIRFLFATGCRPSEAIALTFDSIQWVDSKVTISEAIAISNDGSKASKETKTGVIRVIPLSLKLKMLLAVEYEIYFKKELTHNLVFASPNSSFIDLGNFRSRVWVKALEIANVPYRTIYNCRHTFCSHFLNETPDFVKLSSITHGTKSGVQTLIKHYAHIVDKPVMPDMF